MDKKNVQNWKKPKKSWKKNKFVTIILIYRLEAKKINFILLA
jgi:hypothetical protein